MNENNLITGLSQSSGEYFMSLSPSDEKDRKILFKAMTNPDKRLADMINMTIIMKDIFCEVVQVTNENSGEVENAPRIVIIDDKGISYACVSQGIYNAIKRIIALYGAPTWDPGIKVKILQISKKNRNILSIEIV